jgi:hypothetical protein
LDVKHRFTRSIGVAAVALFLVSGAVFGANALSQAPSGTPDASQVTSNESASPEPVETPEASESAETAEPAETAESAATADYHGGGSGSDGSSSGSDDSGHDGGGHG